MSPTPGHPLVEEMHRRLSLHAEMADFNHRCLPDHLVGSLDGAPFDWDRAQSVGFYYQDDIPPSGSGGPFRALGIESQHLPAYQSVLDHEEPWSASSSRSSSLTHCYHCGQIFHGAWARGNLARHMKTQHRSTSRLDANLRCEICLRWFKRSDAKLKHMRKHDPNFEDRPLRVTESPTPMDFVFDLGSNEAQAETTSSHAVPQASQSTVLVQKSVDNLDATWRMSRLNAVHRLLQPHCITTTDVPPVQPVPAPQQSLPRRTCRDDVVELLGHLGVTPDPSRIAHFLQWLEGLAINIKDKYPGHPAAYGVEGALDELRLAISTLDSGTPVTHNPSGGQPTQGYTTFSALSPYGASPYSMNAGVTPGSTGTNNGNGQGQRIGIKPTKSTTSSPPKTIACPIEKYFQLWQCAPRGWEGVPCCEGLHGKIYMDGLERHLKSRHRQDLRISKTRDRLACKNCWEYVFNEQEQQYHGSGLCRPHNLDKGEESTRRRWTNLYLHIFPNQDYIPKPFNEEYGYTDINRNPSAAPSGFNLPSPATNQAQVLHNNTAFLGQGQADHNMTHIARRNPDNPDDVEAAMMSIRDLLRTINRGPVDFCAWSMGQGNDPTLPDRLVDSVSQYRAQQQSGHPMANNNACLPVGSPMPFHDSGAYTHPSSRCSNQNAYFRGQSRIANVDDPPPRPPDATSAPMYSQASTDSGWQSAVSGDGGAHGCGGQQQGDGSQLGPYVNARGNFNPMQPYGQHAPPESHDGAFSRQSFVGTAGSSYASDVFDMDMASGAMEPMEGYADDMNNMGNPNACYNHDDLYDNP